MLKSAFSLMFSLILLWMIGFLYFIYILPTVPSDKLKKTEAIVVWTGGGCRVATGLELLASGISDKLLISGVGHDNETQERLPKILGNELRPETTLEEDLKKDQNNRSDLSLNNQQKYLSLEGNKGGLLNVFQKSCQDCSIDLTHEKISLLFPKISIGYLAKTTIGNAIETKRWVRSNKIHSIRLVTSPMHIPRSLIECSRYLPDIKVIIHPVEIHKFNHYHWYKDWRIAYKVATEYSKYLSILVGIRIQRQENLHYGKEGI